MLSVVKAAKPSPRNAANATSTSGRRNRQKAIRPRSIVLRSAQGLIGRSWPVPPRRTQSDRSSQFAPDRGLSARSGCAPFVSPRSSIRNHNALRCSAASVTIVRARIRCARGPERRERVRSLREANVYEAQRYRHVIGVPLIAPSEGSAVRAQTSFIVARIMHSGETTLFATGRYHDHIVLDDGEARFAEKIVILDSRLIDTLLAIPL